ncbi:hypothetical protein RUM44_003422 [Polyplax serrata]|uniref:Protein eyes shut homolog n=1 Tax=Polyplax serrata TaxID=468196 RepID=A0ABR1AGD6_POLSC
MSGQQITSGPHADSGSAWVYVGGVPIQYTDPDEVPVLDGFVGCMQNLKIDSKPRGIFKDSFDSVGISECKSLACLSNPCRSGSTCVEHNGTWTCLCPSGYVGLLCETSICTNNPCQFGGTCVPFPGSGFVCLCPLGKQGLFCENNIEIACPLFASSIGGLSSFAAYKLPTEIYQDLQLTFKFVPHDVEQISLMLFLGQDGYHGATSDHLAISYIKGYIVLTWNLGSGPRRIFTTNPLSNTGHSFHTAKIGRFGQRAWLMVDNQQNVTGRSPGKLTQLNTRSVIYLGGHHSRNFSVLPHDLPLHTGFSGCIFDVELRTGQMLIKVEKSVPAFSRALGQCGTTLCNEHSCKNGGGCISHGATYTCLCSEGWFGPTCSTRYNPCDSSRHNCSQGSTCVPLKNEFFCDCPVGKTGKFCEISEDLSDVKLKGIRSYIALSVDGLNHYQSCIDLEIRPQNNHGLILYSGRSEGTTFWSLSLRDGMVEFRVSPGVTRKRGEVLVIKNKRMLALDKWHRIRAGRYGRRLFVWVEGTVSTGQLLPGENLPPSGTTIYLGGAPDLSKLPLGVSGSVLKPFQGCMRKFGSQWRRIQLTTSNILHGRNVEDCDGTFCGGDMCNNGGTCHLNNNNETFCICPKQYTGPKCEFRLSCHQISCQNGGRCADSKGRNPQCYCPNGWIGPFCESSHSVKVPQFEGNSYLLVDRSDTINSKKRDARTHVNFIHINFTTAQPNGFLLWSSSESNSEFIGIGVQNEKMKFVWAWEGHDTTILIPGRHVADGAWHELTVGFESPNITIWLDQLLLYSSNESYPGYPLTTNGKFFLGGFPDNIPVPNGTFGHFHAGFDGCLQQLSWNLDSPITNFSKFNGENIRTCDVFGR